MNEPSVALNKKARESQL